MFHKKPKFEELHTCNCCSACRYEVTQMDLITSGLEEKILRKFSGYVCHLNPSPVTVSAKHWCLQWQDAGETIEEPMDDIEELEVGFEK